MSTHASRAAMAPRHPITHGPALERVVAWERRPALRAATLAQRLLALAFDRGRPGGWPRHALAAAAVISEFDEELQLVHPIPAWQRVLAHVAAPLAKLLGYAEGPRALRAMCDVGHQLELTGQWTLPARRVA